MSQPATPDNRNRGAGGPSRRSSPEASVEKTALDGLLTQTEWVQRLAGNIVADPNDRDDVVQRAWLSAIEGLSSLEGGAPDRPKAWFATILRNSFRKMRRDESLRRIREAEAPPPQKAAPTPEEIVHQATVHREVVDAVLALDEPYRSTILLRYFEGLSPRAIATQTETPPETVATRLKRGRERLRQHLEGHFGGDPRPLAVILLPLLGASVTRSVLAAPLASAQGAVSSSTPPALSPWIGGLLMSANVKMAISVAAVVAALFFLWPTDAPTTRTEERTPVGPSSPMMESSNSTAAEPFNDLEDSADEPVALGSSVATTKEAETEETKGVGESSPLGGIVVDADGAPVAEALVFVADPALNDSWSSPEALGRLALPFLDGKIPEDVLSVETDAEGRFHFAAVAPGTRWSVAALHEIEGLALLTGVPVAAEFSPVEVELVFTGGVRLSGRVTDESGEPVAGARVSVGGMRETPDGWIGTTVANATTNERGEYRVFRLPYPQMNVSAFDFSYCNSRQVEFSADNAREGEIEIDLVLGSRRRMSGALVSADGAPLALETRVPAPTAEGILSGRHRWSLCLTSHDPRTRPSFDPMSHYSKGEIETSEDRYSIEFCDKGPFLSVWFGSTLLGVAEIEDQVGEEGDGSDAGEEGPEIVLDFSALGEMEPTDGVLAIRIIDAETSEVIPGAQIQLAALERALDPRTLIRNATADSDGSFTAEELAYGLQEVTVLAEGYAPFREVFEVGAPDRSDAAQWEITLYRPNSTLKGIVVDRAGAPVHDARLFLCLPSGLPAIPGYASESSNLDGEFEFSGIAPGEYLIAVEGEGIAAAVTPASTASEDLMEMVVEAGIKLDIRPNPADGFSQRVLDARGLPLYDDRRTGAKRAGGSSVRLVPGVPVTIEIYCYGHEVLAHSFTPTEGEGPLVLELVPE